MSFGHMGPGHLGMMRGMTKDQSVLRARLDHGTTRRVMGYARPFLRSIIAFLTLVVLDAGIVVAVPLLLRDLVDVGVIPKAGDVVVRLALLVAALAVADAVLGIAQRWFSSRIGEGLILQLRTEVFAHVLRQPIAFFTRAQTGSWSADSTPTSSAPNRRSRRSCRRSSPTPCRCCSSSRRWPRSPGS